MDCNHMIIDHIGIVVSSLEAGILQWETLFGYRRASAIVTNSRQKVKVVFLEKPNSTLVKLVEPLGDDSPVARFARKGGGLHHLCFRCDRLTAQVSRLKEHGVRFLVPPEPGEAFQGGEIAFGLVSNLNFELIDTAGKSGRLLIIDNGEFLTLGALRTIIF